MAEIRAAAEGVVAAPAPDVYHLIADYRSHHHRFLPPTFSDYRVEEGGVGDGTVVRFRVTVGGRGRDYRTRIAEPAPGRVMTESDPAAGTVTTFTVEPEGGQSRVRIETAWHKPGLVGAIERLLAPRLLRPLYADELVRLDRYAREQAAGLGALVAGASR